MTSRFATALVLLFVLVGCSKQATDESTPISVEKDWAPLVDGDRAFADLKAFAEIGGFSHAPEHRENLERARGMIRDRLQALGFSARDIRVDS
ncbi:MAG: hypothetical protein KDB18_14230, partial [Salinibacterium sp.]|nr:hypothetical protein [Salinibacterium sp.]